MKLACELFANSDVGHLQQIYAGYGLLHQSGFLDLTQTIPAEFLRDKNDPDRWTDYKFFNTKVVLNNQITVRYDLHDWNWIDEDILRKSDFYFKRSFDAGYISQIGEKAKVFPLGLNYQVTSSGRDFFKLQRSRFYSGKARLKAIIKSLNIAESLGRPGEVEQINNLEGRPDFSLEPKILFMARAWDHQQVESKNQQEAIAAINDTRANCVRVLRKEFGDRFFGGLAHDDYSRRHFRDVLLPGQNVSDKRNYLDTLRNYPICVATAGLNGSNGWKLGEYVAFSKAIITEPLVFQVPGDFAAEKNYLEFTDPAELLEAAVRLFENKQLRLQMMMNNYRYYQAWVRPDSLILNTLAVVFGN